MDKRCFCPPETFPPPCAIEVSNRSGLESINSIACAISEAFMISFSLESLLP